MVLRQVIFQTAIVVTAMAHDVHHLGVNNIFLSCMLTPLVVTYNDISALAREVGAMGINLQEYLEVAVVADLPVDASSDDDEAMQEQQRGETLTRLRHGVAVK